MPKNLSRSEKNGRRKLYRTGGFKFRRMRGEGKRMRTRRGGRRKMEGNGWIWRVWWKRWRVVGLPAVAEGDQGETRPRENEEFTIFKFHILHSLFLLSFQRGQGFKL
ncbi:unnamed protein product [Cochlearia groenlandica]